VFLLFQNAGSDFWIVYFHWYVLLLKNFLIDLFQLLKLWMEAATFDYSGKTMGQLPQVNAQDSKIWEDGSKERNDCLPWLRCQQQRLWHSDQDQFGQKYLLYSGPLQSSATLVSKCPVTCQFKKNNQSQHKHRILFFEFGGQNQPPPKQYQDIDRKNKPRTSNPKASGSLY